MRHRTVLPAVIAVAVLTAGCGGSKTLAKAGQQQPTKPKTAPTAYGSAGLLATPTTAPRTTSAPTRSAPRRSTPAPAPAATVKPTGRVLIAHYERLPQSQQTSFGCDRLWVDLRNASSAKVRSVSVGFVTEWYRADDPTGDSLSHGRNVIITKSVDLPAGKTKRFQYDVCIAENNSSHVFAEPVSTSWIWASS